MVKNFLWQADSVNLARCIKLLWDLEEVKRNTPPPVVIESGRRCKKIKQAPPVLLNKLHLLAATAKDVGELEGLLTVEV